MKILKEKHMIDYKSPEKDLIDLALGKRKPKNKFEKRVLRQIKAIRKKGGLIVIPHD